MNCRCSPEPIINQIYMSKKISYTYNCTYKPLNYEHGENTSNLLVTKVKYII